MSIFLVAGGVLLLLQITIFISSEQVAPKKKLQNSLRLSHQYLTLTMSQEVRLCAGVKKHGYRVMFVVKNLIGHPY